MMNTDRSKPTRGASGSAAKCRRDRRGRRGGFTIVELLVVTAIIIILLSVLIVAMNAAARTGQKTRTQFLMDSIKKGLIRFKGDVGYYPPVLGKNSDPAAPSSPGANAFRDLYPPRINGPSFNIQDWHSSTTLAEYMLGYGDHYEDGYGETNLGDPKDWSCQPNPGLNAPPPPCETPKLGIRNPGTDGVWGASTTAPGGSYGRYADRAANFGGERDVPPNPNDQGKVLGPYIELKDERLLASIDGTFDANGNLNVFFPGDGGYNDSNPKVIVDYWGSPLRYYRRPYPQGVLGQSFRSVNGSRVPTLSDVFLLRPYTVKPGSESAGNADAAGNTVSTRDLDAAEFAIFSPGPDRRLNQNVTVDAPDEFNRDNIVEVGGS